MTVNLSVNTKVLIRNSNGTFRERKSFTPALTELSGTKLKDIVTLSEALDKIDISVGWDNKLHSKAKVPYSQLASWLENGIESRGIPARPYLSKSSQIVSRRLSPRIREVLRRASSSSAPITRTSLEAALGVVAKRAADETRRVILSRAVSVPSNAQSTINRKGNNLPWVDTRELINAMRGKVNVNL